MKGHVVAEGQLVGTYEKAQGGEDDDAGAVRSHGAPTTVLEPEAPFARRCARSASAVRPAAIAIVSAHWQTRAPEVRVTGAERPPLIYDFGGFPRRCTNAVSGAGRAGAGARDCRRAGRRARRSRARRSGTAAVDATRGLGTTACGRRSSSRTRRRTCRSSRCRCRRRRRRRCWRSGARSARFARATCSSSARGRSCTICGAIGVGGAVGARVRRMVRRAGSRRHDLQALAEWRARRRKRRARIRRASTSIRSSWRWARPAAGETVTRCTRRWRSARCRCAPFAIG